MRRLAVVFIVLMFAALGCAKKSETIASPAASATARASSKPMTTLQGLVTNKGTKAFTTQNFKVELEQDNEGSEYYFKPTFIRAAAGGTATIELKNEGSVEHNLTIPLRKVNQDLEPGKSKTLTLKMGSDSFVPFYCKYHKASGMQGSFQLH
jgi:plastocyanin